MIDQLYFHHCSVYFHHWTVTFLSSIFYISIIYQLDSLSSNDFISITDQLYSHHWSVMCPSPIHYIPIIDNASGMDAMPRVPIVWGDALITWWSELDSSCSTFKARSGHGANRSGYICPTTLAYTYKLCNIMFHLCHIYIQWYIQLWSKVPDMHMSHKILYWFVEVTLSTTQIGGT